MKTVEEIFEEMRLAYGQHTGVELTQGCDLYARLYALAAQIYALYVQNDWVTRQVFPQTARQEGLDYHAQMRGLTRKPAVAAQGVVRFFAQAAEQEKVIPTGTVCMTAGLVRFETTQEGRIKAGQTSADVPVQAVEAGAAGNVPGGAIVSMAVAPVGISTCTNPQPCTGGADQEGDEGLRERVLETFRRLPNGANAAFYQQGALSFERVAAAVVVPRPRGTGTVDVVVATLSGLPEQQLLTELADYFHRRREIAVELQVRAPQTVAVNVTVAVTAEEGAEAGQVRSGVEQAIRGWFTGKRLGKSILRSELGDIIYHCGGVKNYSITTPAADVAVAGDVLPVLGSLRLEAMA